MTRASGGFTLVEMLVALFIFAVVSAAGVVIITFGIDAKTRSADAADRLKEVQLARALLKADLAQAVSRPTRDAYGGSGTPPFTGGVNERTGPTILTLVRGGAGGLGTGPQVSIQFVRYELEDGTLYRVSRPRLDPTPETPRHRRAVLSGIRDLEIAFYRSGTWVPRIGAATDSGADLPKAVALETELAGIGHLRQLFLVGGGA